MKKLKPNYIYIAFSLLIFILVIGFNMGCSDKSSKKSYMHDKFS